jgi:hypothetical protein
VASIGQRSDATSAMSSVSTKGSLTERTGRATSPAMIGSSQKFSLKFWEKKLQRRIVQAAPLAGGR